MLNFFSFQAKQGFQASLLINYYYCYLENHMINVLSQKVEKKPISDSCFLHDNFNTLRFNSPVSIYIFFNFSNFCQLKYSWIGFSASPLVDRIAWYHTCFQHFSLFIKHFGKQTEFKTNPFIYTPQFASSIHI